MSVLLVETLQTSVHIVAWQLGPRPINNLISLLLLKPTRVAGVNGLFAFVFVCAACVCDCVCLSAELSKIESNGWNCNHQTCHRESIMSHCYPFNIRPKGQKIKVTGLVIKCKNTGASPGQKNVGWTHMASAKREPIMRVWGLRPQRDPAAEPLVKGRSPPEAGNLLAFGCPTEAANLPHSPYFANSLNHRYFWYISQKNWRYRTRWHGQYCVSTEKQFGIVLLVMCEVALQSRLNQHKL